MLTLAQYIKDIRSKGKQIFSTIEAVNTMKTSKENFYKSASRLKKKGDLISPFKGLYVPIPPEYRSFGCLPPNNLIPILMKYLGLNYYVGILSAAKYYGASHQKPMEFQVVTNKQLKYLVCGKVRVAFIYKKSIDNVPTKSFTSDTGYLLVSTPEATAMDVLNYPRHSVGINNIATVLSELIEEIDINKLIEVANISEQRAWIQRMGYILEHIDTMVEDHQKSIIDALEKYLSNKKTSYVTLSSINPRSGFKRDKKWKIIENTTVDSDL